MSQATKIPTLPLPGQAMALGYAVTLAADGHSSTSYSKDAAQLIEEWNRKLGAAGANVAPASQIAFGGPA